MVRIEHTNPQEATLVLLAEEHAANCPVCGGRSRVRVSPLRLRGESWVAAWPSVVAACPLRLGSDDLRSLLPQDTGSSE